MKCEHCGAEAPERAVICPECGEILKRAPQETAEKKTAAVPMPDGFAMPFLAATGTDGDSSTTTEDPREIGRAHV